VAPWELFCGLTTSIWHFRPMVESASGLNPIQVAG
jgi:hypothetical protein